MGESLFHSNNYFRETIERMVDKSRSSELGNVDSHLLTLRDKAKLLLPIYIFTS